MIDLDKKYTVAEIMTWDYCSDFFDYEYYNDQEGMAAEKKRREEKIRRVVGDGLSISGAFKKPINPHDLLWGLEHCGALREINLFELGFSIVSYHIREHEDVDTRELLGIAYGKADCYTLLEFIKILAPQRISKAFKHLDTTLRALLIALRNLYYNQKDTMFFHALCSAVKSRIAFIHKEKKALLNNDILRYMLSYISYKLGVFSNT